MEPDSLSYNPFDEYGDEHDINIEKPSRKIIKSFPLSSAKKPIATINRSIGKFVKPLAEKL